MKQKKPPAFWETTRGKFLINCFLKAAENSEKFPDFLGQICTKNELVELGRRLFVAQYLFSGLPYKAIHAYTGMSTVGIARLSKKVNYRASGVYQVFADLRTEARIEELERKKIREARSIGYHPPNES